MIVLQNTLLSLLGGIDNFEQDLVVTPESKSTNAAASSSGQDLLDLLGGLDLGTGSTPVMQMPNVVNNNLTNLLTAVAPAISAASASNYLIDDLFGGGTFLSSFTPPPASMYLRLLLSSNFDHGFTCQYFPISIDLIMVNY